MVLGHYDLKIADIFLKLSIFRSYAMYVTDN